MHYKKDNKIYQERVEKWNKIEELVLNYQMQFKEEASQEDIEISKKSADELLECFSPLFNKYMTLLKTGQIDWNDYEMKHFVANFIDDATLKKALYRTKQKSEYRGKILSKFNFIIETYGKIDDKEKITDLQTALLIIGKRYKKMGKNFCAYVYNSYRYEVARHIKKFTVNPLNIQYKNLEYENCINGYNIGENDYYEDNYYEDSTGIPNLTWVQGSTCSDLFSCLSPLDRKILIKYYLEEWKDGQIADSLGMHINTVNQKRRQAAKIIAEKLNLDLTAIKRTRKSGRKAVLPTQK